MYEEEIERLKAQVKRAEEKGNFDTAHHQMLKKYLALAKAAEPKNAEKVKQEKQHGK